MPTSQREFPADRYPHGRLTGMVIAAAHVVHRTLGYGFLESVYRRAMVIGLRHMGVSVAEEAPYTVPYRGQPAGLFRADVVAECTVIVEVKTGRLPNPEASTQILNYLRASKLDVGLFVHFGPRLSIKRLVYTGSADDDATMSPIT